MINPWLILRRGVPFEIPGLGEAAQVPGAAAFAPMQPGLLEGSSLQHWQPLASVERNGKKVHWTLFNVWLLFSVLPPAVKTMHRIRAESLQKKKRKTEAVLCSSRWHVDINPQCTKRPLAGAQVKFIPR